MSKLLKHTFCFGLAALCMAGCSDDDANVTDSMGSHDVDKMEKPARNPDLAQETYSITHFNSAQTDAFAYAVKDGIYNVDLAQCPSTWSGPVNLMTLASTSPDYMWGMSSDRVS